MKRLVCRWIGHAPWVGMAGVECQRCGEVLRARGEYVAVSDDHGARSMRQVRPESDRRDRPE